MTDWKADTGQAIEKLYAWVSRDEDGGEGVLAHRLPGLGMMPLVGADRARMESYRPFAQTIARETGRQVFLKVYQAGAVIDSLGK